MTDADPDLTNLPRFLEHLEQRDAVAAWFARRLVDAGGTVRVFWGPQQMDVWELRVQRGQMIVRFGVERGYSDGVMIARADAHASWNDLRPMRLAVLAWARANGIPLRLSDPEDLDVDLTSVGIVALDWVGAGHDTEVERVWRAWHEYRQQVDLLQGRTRGRPDGSDLAAVKAAGIAALEAAARSVT
ncbi:hypothetical protein [Orlajensenia leifsoniae]|uniref:Uncharacterized protein n=1 Tax=Orlajensenia leifsoniae TaxID=2561933 RepID=A0A4Y9R7F9_9MICO|nr:hypothetical protein [Leifsonia flava]TFW00188.1 hypothetical protein E4M00_03100 [Leifsonia flava]